MLCLVPYLKTQCLVSGIKQKHMQVFWLGQLQLVGAVNIKDVTPYLYIYNMYILSSQSYIYILCPSSEDWIPSCSFSLPDERSKSNPDEPLVFVALKHSHQDRGFSMPLGMILSLRLLIHMNPCNGFDAANVVKPFPLRSGSLFCLFLPTTYAAYVTGLMLWVSGIEGQSFPTAINHAYPWMTRGWYHICYFHNSCKKHWTFAGHIQPVYNNHSLDFEFETKSNLCRFVQYQTTMINIVPSHGNFHSQGFWNDWCWCFQKWWSPITKGKPVYFGVPFLSFYCRRSLRDNFPINYWTIRYHAVFACMINCTYCIHILWYCLNFDYIYI